MKKTITMMTAVIAALIPAGPEPTKAILNLSIQ